MTVSRCSAALATCMPILACLTRNDGHTTSVERTGRHSWQFLPGWGLPRAPGVARTMRVARFVVPGSRLHSTASPWACTLPAPGSIIVGKRGFDMTAWVIAASVVVALTANGVARAQSTGATGLSRLPNPVVLVDSTGKVVARPLNETIMLVTISGGVAAPALIRPIYDPDGRTASALATWQAGGSVLFTSSDCTVGAHVYSSPHAGVRASTQVQTAAGIMLYVGAVGTATTVAIHSILYDTGCAPVIVQQNGLLPVLATVNLNTAYPPPLSFQ